MRLLPVVARELGAISRRRSSYWIRTGAAFAAFLAMAYTVLIGFSSPLLSQGKSLFQVLSFFGFAYCLAAGIRGTSDALSEEKREGTLGLLFLTDLKGYDVVIGKFVSLSINSFYGILAIVPALALAFLLGGVSPTQFLLMSLCLVNTLFLSLAVGIFVSTFSHHERQAMGATLGILFLMAILPYALATAHTYDILEIWEVMIPGFLITSPVFTFRTVSDANLVRIFQDEVILSIVFSQLTGWLCLIVASASIAARAHQDAPKNRFLVWFQNFRVQMAYGKTQHRRALRARTLDRNAFSWLAGRDRLKSRYAWVFLGLLGVLWLVGVKYVPDLLRDWPVHLFSIWFLHLFFKVWIASEVAARFIEDRRSNALELLLTTPLSVKEFAAGQRLALLRQFGGPLLALLALNYFAARNSGNSFGYALHSSQAPYFFLAGVVNLLVDIYAIHWVAIWRSLHLRGTNRTILQTTLLIIILPTIGYFLFFQMWWVLSITLGSQPPEIVTMVVRWTALCVVYDLLLIRIARGRFQRDFRETATQAFDDPAHSRSKTKRVEKVVPRPKKKFRPWRWAIPAAIVLVVIIFASIRRHTYNKAVETKIALLRSQNIPTRTLEISYWRPAPPGSDQLSRTLTRLFQTHTPPPRPFDFRRGELDQYLATNRQAVTDYLQKNEPLFKILKSLPDVPMTRQPFELFYRGIVSPDTVIEAVQLKAYFELESNPAQAARTINRLVHLARAFETQNQGASTLSFECLRAVSSLFEKAARDKSFNELQWRECKMALDQLDPIGSLRDAVIVMRAQGLEYFNMPPDQLRNVLGMRWALVPALFNINLAVRRFVGQDQKEVLEYLRIMEEGIADLDRPFWERPVKATLPRHREPSLGGSYLLIPQITPAFDFMKRSSLNYAMRLRLVQLAAEIEIYRVQHGQLPKILTARNGTTSELDLFVNRPLNYRPNENGRDYILYSVGEDTIDNGGGADSKKSEYDIVFDTQSKFATPRMKRN